MENRLPTRPGISLGDALFRLVDALEPPLRLLLGKIGYPTVKAVYEQRLATWEAWNEVSTAAHGQ